MESEFEPVCSIKVEKLDNGYESGSGDVDEEDDYDDFVVMCPSCNRVFSNESERLQHDFDNCTDPPQTAITTSNEQSVRLESLCSRSQTDGCLEKKRKIHPSSSRDDISTKKMKIESLLLKKGASELVFQEPKQETFIQALKFNGPTDDILSLQAEYEQFNMIKDIPSPKVQISNKTDTPTLFFSNSTNNLHEKRTQFQNSGNYFHFISRQRSKTAQKNDESQGNTAEDTETGKYENIEWISPFSCEKCDRVFVNRQGLSHHRSTHSNKKLFTCCCGCGYSTLENLKVHQKIHKKDKHYKCDKCVKSFTSKQGWVYHMAVHSGLKPFKCKFCDKAYAYDVALHAHLKRHARLNDFGSEEDTEKLSAT